ncbi:pachytene checkpoint protein 2 homolog [Planococcus citri]|uniref:pachytene checkpoint protein 2 homolog n=1 Tax=Planococcus citri TaxID=170843 RepID=UPI0031F7BD5D
MKMKCVVHVEVIQHSNSNVEAKDLECLVDQELQDLGSVRPGQSMTSVQFTSDILKKNIISVKISESSELAHNYNLDPENLTNLSLDKVSLQFHTYRLEEEEIQSEQLNISSDGDNETISAANYCLLPHVSFHGIWENLIYDNNIKENLLDYASTSMIFSQYKVNTNVISWNRVILLYGPPGTGKTSLCKGLAQKLSIRLKKNYKIAEFIEINSHSLFSKYYSESGKLVMQMFSKIKEHLEYGESLVCVLIDEIESLTHARNACMNGAEPSDSIRVVNAILTQLDQIRRYPNVLILTTSNLKSAIDVAFVDRADLQIYVGPPSKRAIYEIFVSCLKELIRVNLIKLETEIDFLSVDCLSESEEKSDVNFTVSRELFEVAKSCDGLSGRILRKLPFLAYSSYSKSEKKSINNYIQALQSAVDQYRANNKSIFGVHCQ